MSDLFHARFAQGKLAQQAGLDAGEFVGACRCVLHRGNLARDHVGGLDDVVGVAGVLDQVDAARPAGLQQRLHRVHQAGILAQIDAEPR